MDPPVLRVGQRVPVPLREEEPRRHQEAEGTYVCTFYLIFSSNMSAVYVCLLDPVVCARKLHGVQICSAVSAVLYRA